MSNILRNLFCFFVVFSVVFRPSILLESFSTIFIVFFIALTYAFCSRAFLLSFFKVYGAGFLLLILFILIYSFILDVLEGGYVSLMTSMTGYTLRMICYLIVGHYIARYVVRYNWEKLFSLLFFAVVFQIVLAFLMLASPSFKLFFLERVAGFSSSSKFLSEDFIGIRNFGWSLELFYTAPVVIVMISTLTTTNYLRLKNLLYYLASLLLALINARVAMAALPFVFYIRYGFARSAFFGIIFFLIIFLVIFSLDISILDNFKAEFQGGRSRTLDILLDSHVQFHLKGIENLTGLNLMVYANPQSPFHSDIGWIIALHYGGWVFLFMMVIFFLLLSYRAFSGIGPVLMAFLMLVMLGIKGPVFAGNGVIALYAIFASMGKYNRSLVQEKK